MVEINFIKKLLIIIIVVSNTLRKWVKSFDQCNLEPKIKSIQRAIQTVAITNK